MAFRGNPAEQGRPAPRLYLVTPQPAEGLAERLAEALAAADVAAVLLRLPMTDAGGRIDFAKALAPAVQDQGVALILDGEPELTAPAGADGAHLTGLASLATALPKLKPARIAGCGGLRSRHDAMLAGEAGADYVMFGEPDAAGQRPMIHTVAERVAWWAELFEVPCVGFAAALDEVEHLAAAGADFIAVGECVFDDRRGCAAAMGEAASRLASTEVAA